MIVYGALKKENSKEFRKIVISLMVSSYLHRKDLLKLTLKLLSISNLLRITLIIHRPIVGKISFDFIAGPSTLLLSSPIVSVIHASCKYFDRASSKLVWEQSSLSLKVENHNFTSMKGSFIIRIGNLRPLMSNVVPSL
ncbi:hypothetical protein VNO77_33696 [Canavalia gladiata]|uniref:Uncharacterized protein n=1 Tax=Canavalia gladiata TaxID=3824 RepID=A0AAN9KF67_CANGL